MELCSQIVLGAAVVAWALAVPAWVVAALLIFWAGGSAYLKFNGDRRGVVEIGFGRIGRALAWRGGVVGFLIVIVFGAAWVVIRLRQWDSFGYSPWTLSLYANVVSNSLHGHVLYSSVMGMNHLGTHWSPIVLGFVPLYGIFGEDPRILMIVQALAVAAAAALLIVYAKAWIPDRANATVIGTAAALAFLIYEPMSSAVMQDFHPSTLAPPFLVLGLIALRKQNVCLLVFAAGALLCIKESAVVMLASLALYAWLVMGNKRKAAVLFAAGALLGVVYFGWVMPHFNHSGWHQAGRVAGTSFFEWESTGKRLIYLLRLFGPLAFLPLLDWRMLAVVAPNIVLNLATNYGPQLSARSHYDDAVAPLLAVALIHLGGLDRSYRTDGTDRILKAACLLLPFTLLLLSGGSPGDLYRQYKPKPDHARLHEALCEYARLPYDQPIIAPGKLAAPLAQRCVVSRKQTALAPEDFVAGNLLVLSPQLNNRRAEVFKDSQPLIEANRSRLETLRRDKLLWIFKVVR
ncbi:DUF2079 domain-containing protein [bacterium]|nr:DUF2079 domain-containing protein [bacterium]